MAPKPAFTKTVERTEQALQVLKSIRKGRVLQHDARWLVLHCFFSVANNSHSSSAPLPMNVKKRTACLLGIAHTTVAKIVKSFTDKLHRVSHSATTNATFEQLSAIPIPNTPCNRIQRNWCIMNSQATYVTIRDFVRASRQKKKRVTATQVLELIIEKGILYVPDSEDPIERKRNKANALRATQRWLKRKGFRRGKRSGHISQNSIHVAWRHRFLRALRGNDALPIHLRRCLVYTDESYIHHHHNRCEESLYDPNDASDSQVRMQYKGKRFCFISAIQNANPEHPIQNPSCLVRISTWIFCPQAGKAAHCGDYHKAFNGKNYVQWWKECLLPNLSEPSLILVDNAKYHRVKPFGTPEPHKLKKAQLQEALTEYGIQFDEGSTAKELKLELRKHISENVEMEIVLSAKEEGHAVLFTPPHHSDFQPIELIWAFIKGNVGRMYDDSTTLSDVRARLEKQFDLLETEVGIAEI